MNFSLTEEHGLIRDMARDFAENELKPGVIERDKTETFDPALLKRMGELGFMGMMVDPQYAAAVWIRYPM